MTMTIKFNCNTDKAVEYLAWVAKEWASEKDESVTVYFTCKIMYFAELYHMQQYGRPIIGDWYVPMKDGPVPSRIYELIKRNVRPETVEKVNEVVTIGRKEDRWPMTHNRDHDGKYFSESDMECLEQAFNHCKDKSFGQLMDETHRHEGWKQAYNDSDPSIDYALIIAEGFENPEAIIQEIKETAATVIL